MASVERDPRLHVIAHLYGSFQFPYNESENPSKVDISKPRFTSVRNRERINAFRMFWSNYTFSIVGNKWTKFPLKSQVALCSLLDSNSSRTRDCCRKPGMQQWDWWSRCGRHSDLWYCVCEILEPVLILYGSKAYGQWNIFKNAFR